MAGNYKHHSQYSHFAGANPELEVAGGGVFNGGVWSVGAGIDLADCSEF